MFIRTPSLQRLFVLTLFAFVCMSGGCVRGPREIVLAGPTMGTTYSIKIAGREVDAHAIEQSIERTLAQVDEQMSTYRADSELSRFNASRSTEWFSVSADLANVVAESQRIAELTGGAFDVTVAPLVELWGFGTSEAHEGLPTDEQIAATRARCGYRHLSVRTQPASLRKDIPELSVDLNGIAPGYAVDMLAERFVQAGVENFSIELGGEIRTRGVRADGSPWRIAVEHPLLQGRPPYAVLGVRDQAVSTSGDYRQFYTRDGRRYSHTIDPATGRPIAHSLAAVVVLSPTTAQADGLATALMVLGPDAGFELAKTRHWAALLLTRQAAGLAERATDEFQPWRLAVPKTP